MNMEEKVIHTLRMLPPERQAEVLDFAEFLKRRSQTTRELRPFGLCAGQFRMPDDFDAPLPEEELRLFEL